MIAALWLLACAGAPPSEAPEATFTLRLESPSTVDPWEGVDSVLLEFLDEDGQVVWQERWQGEEARISGMELEGQLRLRIIAFSGGEVRSAGRSLPFAVVPGEDLEVSLRFGPVNRALPLPSAMQDGRYDHQSWSLADGRVALIGGSRPGFGPTDRIELWDPETGEFWEAAARLPMPLARPRSWAMETGELVIAGGAGESEVTETITGLDAEGRSLGALAEMSPRAGHCFAPLGPERALLLGGNAQPDELELLERDSGAWEVSRVIDIDLPADRVRACQGDGSGKVLILGEDQATTGTWDGEAADLREAFSGLPLDAEAPLMEAPALWDLGQGQIWVVGGAALADGSPSAESWIYDLQERAFAPGPDLEQPRIDGQIVSWIGPSPAWEGWVALGCGYADLDRDGSPATVEMIKPSTGEYAPLIALDRDREGCALSPLSDGSLLVSGGGTDLSDPADAALIIPWPDPG